MAKKKLLIVALLAALALAFFAFDLGHWLSLESLKARQAGLAARYAASPALVIAAYAGLYVLVFALALPFGAVMTLAGGALFGLVTGTLVVSFASTIGATLAFLASRHVLADSVRRHLGRRLAEVDQGIERDGAFYLFTLRLMPVLPPAAINLLFGLTKMRTWTFYWVSQLGMLAGTLVYVNAGTQLARLDTASGILSPSLISAFMLVGLLPLLGRKLVATVPARRVHARWAGVKPRRFERNLVVIGAGAAGLVASYIGAAVKARVTLVEAHQMGGDCLNTGCVPSKALIRTATLMQQIRRALDFGIHQATASIDFAQVMARVAAVVRAIAPHDSVERYTGLGVEVLQGQARIVDPWTVQVTQADGRQRSLSTRSIVIATGAAPIIPPLPGLDAVGYLTSNTLWDLRELPPRLLVLGGGPLGCELAQCFARLGSRVTLLEQLPRLLTREDDEVSAFARQALEGDGVRVLTGQQALRCEATPEGKFIVVETGGVEQRLGFDALLCAVGRAARLQGFGLEDLGIPVDRTVRTNEYLQTIYPHIFAAGDVAGPHQFTHAASHQGWVAAVNALFGLFRKFRADHALIPRAIFIDPEVARVGLNEREAGKQGTAYEVTRYGLDALDRAITDSATQGWVKVLTVPGSDRILGVSIVGTQAAELLAEFVLAMKHGLGLKKILATPHIYPTLSQASQNAAGQWQRAHAPQWLMKHLPRLHAWRRGGSAPGL